MATYGYKTYKARYFVAALRQSDGGSYFDILIFGQGREQAFRQFASKHKGVKIERVIEIDPTDIDGMEYYGFTPAITRPATRSIGADY